LQTIFGEAQKLSVAKRIKLTVMVELAAPTRHVFSVAQCTL
jgi:hypothetical protein